MKVPFCRIVDTLFLLIVNLVVWTLICYVTSEFCLSWWVCLYLCSRFPSWFSCLYVFKINSWFSCILIFSFPLDLILWNVCELYFQSGWLLRLESECVCWFIICMSSSIWAHYESRLMKTTCRLLFQILTLGVGKKFWSSIFRINLWQMM